MFIRLKKFCKRISTSYSCKTVIERNTQSILSGLSQGDHLCIDFSNFQKTNIEITTKWQDHCELLKFDTTKINHDSCDNSSHHNSELVLKALKDINDPKLVNLYIVRNDLEMGKFNDIEECLNLSLSVPEYFNVSVNASQLSLHIKNKFQGDLAVSSNEGEIFIDKLRGNMIHLDCWESSVSVKKLLEGNIHINCKNLIAKMVNGDKVDIRSEKKIEIESIYSKDCCFNALEGVKIGQCHGNLKVKNEFRGVDVGGIDGSFDIISTNGNINIQVNKLDKTRQSTVTALMGSINGSIDPEIVANIECSSLSPNSNRDTITIASDAFELFNNTKYTSDTFQKVGRFTGKSTITKRPSFQSNNSLSSGKVDLKAAENQSLINRNVDTSLHSSLEHNDLKIDIIFSSYKNIYVETLSWIEVIRRKYGFLDENEGTKPPSSVGRTAKAS